MKKHRTSGSKTARPVQVDNFLQVQKPKSGFSHPIYIDPDLLQGVQNPQAKAKRLLRHLPDETFKNIDTKGKLITFNGTEGSIKIIKGKVAIIPWHSC